MRVIRTEIYFDEEEPFELRPQSTEPSNPGLAVAWFRAGKFVRWNPDSPGIVAEIVNGYPAPIEDAYQFIAGAVTNRFAFASWEDPSTHDHLVSAALNAQIIIERSPPISLSLGALLKKSPAVAIGTFIGIQAVSEDMAPYVMLATVPGGIIAVSSAIGISRALEQGLNKAVARVFKRLRG